MTIDFGLLPPEINSTRMYTGAGSAPLLAAAAAWDALAAQLYLTAANYSSAISGLTAAWSGPASATMSAAAAPYTAWIGTTAEQAEQAAFQARAAAAAFEAAFAATVPPAAVASNRSRLMVLIATNLFGRNSPAIMATQAEYGEMWAQDAAAMYGYASSSAIASQMVPFSSAPQTANSQGSANQDAAVSQATGTAAGAQAPHLQPLISATPEALQNLATPLAAPAADPPSALSTLNSYIAGPLSPLSIFTVPGVPYLLGIQGYLLPQAAQNLATASGNLAEVQASAAAAAVPRVAPVSAALGRAGMVSGLSVPQGWAAAAPELKMLAQALPESSLGAAPAALAAEGATPVFGNMALSSLAGRAIAGTDGVAARSAGNGGIAAAVQEATTANIFVIHEVAE